MRTATPTIDDLITRGVPGACVFLSITYELFLMSPEWLEPNAQLVIILTGSYTVGTFIDVHKHDIFSPPPFFRRVMYDETGNEKYLRKTTRLKLRFRQSTIVERWNSLPYLPKINSQPCYREKSPFSKNGYLLKGRLELSLGEEISPRNLSKAWNELENQAISEIGRTGQNHHTVYHFILNLAFGMTFTTLIILFNVFQSEDPSTLITILVVIFMLGFLMFELKIVGKYGKRYAESLLRGAYSSTTPRTTSSRVSS